MLRSTLYVALAVGAAFATTASADALGYEFDVTTSYSGSGACDVNGFCGSPDTGYATVTNNGATSFTGTISLTNDGGSSLSNSTNVNNWGTGSSIFLASGPEGSNQGGFGPLGLLLEISGFVTNGVSNENIDLKVHDGDIHSGTFRISPCDGINSDSFVLQGGSPNGCDNGDGFEESQANGSYSFVERATVVPEPSFLVWGAIGIPVVLLYGRRRRARATAA